MGEETRIPIPMPIVKRSKKEKVVPIPIMAMEKDKGDDADEEEVEENNKAISRPMMLHKTSSRIITIKTRKAMEEIITTIETEIETRGERSILGENSFLKTLWIPLRWRI